MRPSHHTMRGYSLIEALVVVAIIGVISLVTVPNFMSMYRSMKIKSAVRLLTNDVRSARQLAVSRYRPTMVSFGTTAADRNSYWVYECAPTSRCPNPAGSTWIQRKVGQLEPETSPANRSVYFTTVGFPDVDNADGGGRPDIIFETSGAVRQPPADPTLRVRTDANVAKNEFILTVSPSGSVKVQ